MDSTTPPARTIKYQNPYTPGAGHPPPFLAGRELEQREFDKLLGQSTILENVVVTGLRGVGKTVLLDRFKTQAIAAGWLWAGNDLSESASVTEASLAVRLMTDLAIACTGVTMEVPVPQFGFQTGQQTFESVSLSYDGLVAVFNQTPGLVTDKIKAVLLHAWSFLNVGGGQRLVFAYDEAQNLSDHQSTAEFPLSILLEVFQSIQRQGIPFMLVLTGLPTLFPKLVDARTYAERMFRVMTLGRLSEADSEQAITRPINDAHNKGLIPVVLTADSVTMIIRESAGYPYFIQFICREVFDVFLQQISRGEEPTSAPLDAIQRKLDADFFSGRWANLTDRQRDLLWLVSRLANCDDEFTIQEVVEESKVNAVKTFSSSQVSQMFGTLSKLGIVFKNRFGKYSFAVPLMGAFIQRVYRPNEPALPFEPGQNALKA